jgi:hypothetical protein
VAAFLRIGIPLIIHSQFGHDDLLVGTAEVEIDFPALRGYF